MQLAAFGDPGIGHADLNGAAGIHGSLGRVDDLLFVGHVHDHRVHPRFCHFLEHFQAAAGDGDLDALGDKGLGHGQADPGAATRDDRVFALEIHGRSSLIADLISARP